MTNAEPEQLFIDFQSALAGRYSLERELGRGGMGIVYLAREVRLDRLVAIKLLPPHLAAHDPLRERFLREARTAARLSQPNIIPIFTVDDVAGFVFYVMAYVEGETLAHRIATHGPLRPAEAARILREVSWALAYAHAQGIVHRDVKPENILLEQGTGRAMVADFGIARLAQASGRTGVGEVLGTPEFMSPEQAAGEDVDGRSDLYALGVVGYYMLSGRLPFHAETAGAVMAQHLTQPAPPVASVASGVPGAITSAIDRCLAKDPAERYATGEELADALGAALVPTQETPVPVRVFLKRGTNVGVGTVLWYLFLGLPALSKFDVLVARGAGLGSVLLAGGIALAVLGAPPSLLLFHARRLLRHGYGHEDVAVAMRMEGERQAEEAAFEFGAQPSALERVLRGLGLLGMGVGVAGLIAASVLTTGFDLAGAGVLSLLFGGLSFLYGLARRDQRLGKTSRRGRFLTGRFGRWLFRLAGFRLGKREVAPAANRPTELAIGHAAEALFAALNKDTRRALGDLPEAVRRLERRAREIRARVDELDATIAEAKSGRAGSGSEQRHALVGELETAREAARARLGEVVAALETIRLDLLRLRAGVGSVAGITEDLSAAQEVGEQAERLLVAEQEVEAAIRGGSGPAPK
jgi:eukaryotic-like serine/threonine-protein kinase